MPPPYFVIDSFAKGLDRRRPYVGALPGTLWIGTNVHISRGGAIEVVKGWPVSHQLPLGQTFGFARASGNKYVFGSVDPSVFTGPNSIPAGITYQRLEHPSGFAMTAVLSTTIFDGKIYAVAEYVDDTVHHFYDGVRITDFYDGKARGYFTITGGSAGNVSTVKVNGVDALGGTPVAWGTSNSDTATAVAVQINTAVTSPEISAEAVGPIVYVYAAAAGSALNDATLVVTTSGDVVVSPTSSLLAGGGDNIGTSGRFAKTFDRKVYSVSGPLALFTGINKPTKYNQTAVGSGAINMSNHAAGSEELLAIAEYLGLLAFYTAEVVQLWDMDADPEQNAKIQVLSTDGIVAPRTAIPFTSSDLVSLSNAGMRVLRPSETTANLSATAAFSGPIDPLIVAHMATLDSAVIERGLAVVEPRDKRLLVALGDKVYVLSYFPESGVSAWTIYELGFSISEFVIEGSRLYARSGNNIRLYGGETGDEYDEDVVPTVRLVNIHAQAPATYKDFIGFSFGVTGEWQVSIYHDLNDTASEVVAVVYEPTYDQPVCPIEAAGTHMAVEFVGRPSARDICNIAVHFLRSEG